MVRPVGGGEEGRGSDDVVLTTCSDAKEINGQVCVKCSIYILYIVTQTDKHLYDD